MKNQRSMSGVFSLWLLVTGCSGDADAGGGPPQMMPEVSAYDVLAQCAAVEPCAGTRSFAQVIEGGFSRYLDPGTACVFAGLRDRTPGRYLHQTDSTWSNGSAGSNHVVVIREDGSVLYARNTYAYGSESESETSEAGQRCTLKPADFFDACHAAVTSPGGDPDAAFTCAYTGTTTSSAPMDWFHACEMEAAPSCE